MDSALDTFAARMAQNALEAKDDGAAKTIAAESTAMMRTGCMKSDSSINGTWVLLPMKGLSGAVSMAAHKEAAKMLPAIPPPRS